MPQPRRAEIRTRHLSSPDLGAPAGPFTRDWRALRSRLGRSARHRDNGALSLEMAILFPVVLTLTFGAVQVGLWYEARSMCQAAAEAGVRAGKVLHAPAGAGAAAARSYLADVSNGLVVAPIVTENRTAATIGVTCSGQAQNVIPFPGANVGVVQSSQGGVERFTRTARGFGISDGSSDGN